MADTLVILKNNVMLSTEDRPWKQYRNVRTESSVAATLISGISKFNHIFPVSACFQCLSVSFWAQFKMLGIAYKSLNSFRLQYLSESLSKIRYQFHLLLKEATLRETNTVMTRNWAFLVVTPSLWNKLPTEMCQGSSFLIF